MRTLFAFMILLITAEVLYCQVGGVGINTSTPLTMLHVEDSCVLFRGTYSSSMPGSLPVAGAGTRMIWYPGKAAFRAGRVTSSEWNKNNIGDFSFAAGVNTKASGSSSVALGSGTQATGLGSFSMGNNAMAIGDNSTALGLAKAKSFASVVIGRLNDTTSISSTSWNAMDPLFVIGNGTNTANLNNALTVLKNGNIGIGEITPNASLHIGKGISGGPYQNDVAMIIEDDANAYLQFSTPSTSAAGIVSGNTSTEFRSGVIFRMDDGLDLRAGGNTTRLRVESDGDIDLMSGSVRRTETGNADMLPICYGVVNHDGSILNGSDNFTVSVSGSGTYIISIEGGFSFQTMIAVVSGIGHICGYNSDNVDLFISAYDIETGEQTSSIFSFVVYDPDN